jgi:hypothetical protein
VANAARLDDPGALGGVLTGVSFIGGLATGLSLADAPFPRPGADIKDVQRFFQGDAGPERINASGQLLSAASLAVFSASVARLAGRTGPGSRTLQAMAVAGGALASLPGRFGDGRGRAHRRSWPGRGPGQVPAPPPVRPRWAGTRRRAGAAAGRAGAGRAAHRGPATAADDRRAGLGRRRRPRLGRARGPQGGPGRPGRTVPHLHRRWHQRRPPGPRRRGWLRCGGHALPARPRGMPMRS